MTPEEIEALAKTPKRVDTDEGRIDERAIDDVVKGLSLAEAQKVTGPPFGLRIAKANPGNAAGG